MPVALGVAVGALVPVALGVAVGAVVAVALGVAVGTVVAVALGGSVGALVVVGVSATWRAGAARTPSASRARPPTHRLRATRRASGA